ncbi:MAG TPA: MEDS domain-containing protein [Gammaproteobacteria bacterium]|nr:MEDS domain-containing protein [Gammaproteobacteria bacterium]
MSSTVQRGSEHAAQFYESDTTLVETLSALVADSFGDGKRVIILAIASRRRDIERSLIAAGVNTHAARQRNQYLDLDAAQVLSRILVHAEPDPTRFENVVGGLIEDTPPQYRGVWAFGEMVSLLWSQRMYEAALRLEALWNGVAHKYGCSLYRAYPAAEFAGTAGHLRHASTGQSHFPPESLELTSSMHRLRAIEQFRERVRSLRGRERAQDEDERRF